MSAEAPQARAFTELTAAEEARILGISERTVRRNREKRRMARLLKPP